MVLLAVVVAAPSSASTFQTGATVPDDFQWWSQERQQQFLQSATKPDFADFSCTSSRCVNWFGRLFYSLGDPARVTLPLADAGWKPNYNQKVSNLIAWALLPFALREFSLNSNRYHQFKKAD
jgi:hypothetical protein